MKELVAKRYVKALLQAISTSEIESFLIEIQKISSAFGVKEFADIIASPSVCNSKKLELIVSICDNKDIKLQNFFRLLVENNRLLALPSICKELQLQNAKIKNEYTGTICSNTALSNEQISALESKFSAKFNAKIKLVQKSSSTNGVKIEVEDLGIEIGFSREKIQTQLFNHIIKAI